MSALEQIVDLQPGDVVRVTLTISPEVVTEGPVTDDGFGTLRCGPVFLRYSNGRMAGELHDITVVSRAPRPLYVNHPRPEPVDGDIVRDGDGDAWQCKRGRWHLCGGNSPSGVEDISDCSPLTLLWNGETGQVVP